jgi:membrane associated rhomboid family serine protease
LKKLVAREFPLWGLGGLARLDFMLGIDYTVNNGIILVTVLMSIYALQRNDILYGWMLNPPAIDRGQYYRFITSGLIHADFFHLFFNMFTLYFFGNRIEGRFQELYGFDNGKIAYLLFYIISIIVSDIPSYLKNRGNSNYNSLGASGAVSAVLFGAIIFEPTSILGVWFIPMPAFIFAILYLWYTYYEMRRGMSFVNHSAHWWGAIFGIIVIVGLFPNAIPEFINQLVNWRLEDFINQVKRIY